MLADPPDLLITTATVTSPTDEWVPDGYRETWAVLEDAGIPIVGIRDTPRSPVNIPDCVAKRGPDPARCAFDRTLAPRELAPAVASLPATMHVVDLTEWLCDETACPAVIGNVLAYRDKAHFTASFARTLAPMLAEQLPDDEALDSAGSAASGRPRPVGRMVIRRGPSPRPPPPLATQSGRPTPR